MAAQATNAAAGGPGTPAMELIFGKIKKVNSADTIVIWSKGPNGAPTDQMIHLANLVAPKVAVYTPDGKQSDEPCGWEAREALRKDLVGHEVMCEVEHRSPKAIFGYVYKGKSNESQCINELVVSRGHATVKDLNKKNEKYDKLKELVEQAKAKKIGIWADDKASKTRKIQWQLDNAAAFAAKHKKKPLKAVIEGVHPGLGVRAFVKLDGVYHYLTVMLAGIRGPNEKDSLRPRAIYYVEVGLVHQEVQLFIEGAGNNGQLFGMVKHPVYDISVGLVENGLAQLQDWSLATMDPEQSRNLRAAEAKAKAHRCGLWKDYKEPEKSAPIAGGTYQAKVIEVVSADMIVVREANKEPRKIFLASIRPPRRETKDVATEDKNQKRVTMAQRMFQQPLLFQAREFLRSRLIGKTVQVKIDYRQPKSDLYPEKECCTVTVNGRNIAEQLVESGLATVIRYRQDNNDRASQYVELQEAEALAQKNLAGIHAKKEPEPMRVVDLQGDLIKSKQYLSSLQRTTPLTGIVELISSGSRMRVYCEKHSCVFPFLLNGIQCPRAGRPELNGQAKQAGEEFGDEAMQFTKDLCLQHQVTLDVEGQDKNGAMIGRATLDRKNLSVELVKAGLASVHRYSAEKLRYFKELCEAEDSAKLKKLRIWQNYVEATHDETTATAATSDEPAEDTKSDRKVELKSVVVSEVTPEVSKFYVQYKEDGPKLEDLQAKLQKAMENPAIAGTFKRGDKVAAKFLDGNWYRAKIEKMSQGKAEILYLDYGNRGTVEISALQSLPGTGFSGAEFAHPCHLAFVKMPKDEDELASARKTFSHDVTDAELKINIEYRNLGESYVTLRTAEGEDIGKGLIKDGFAYFEPRKGERYRSICQEYQEAMDEAKKEHRNLWEYGDAREDEGDRR